MKLLILFVCLCLFVTNIDGAIARIANAKDPKYPNKCYYKGPPKILMALDTKKRAGGACGAWSCQADYTILLESCGSVGALAHCRVVPGDLSRLYPDCCPEFIC